VHSRPYHPQGRGKNERFHRTLRSEFLTGRTFADLASAQEALDDWIRSYNTERPHQALSMATPASRFLAPGPGRHADTSAIGTEREGDGWISRKITTNGIISVAWQEINCGKHRGRRVDIHLQGPTLQVFAYYGVHG